MFERLCEAVQDAIFSCQLFARLPRSAVSGFFFETDFLGPAPRRFDRLPQVLLEVIRVLEVELARVLGTLELYTMKLLAQGGGSEPLPQGGAAFVWFHDGVELLYVLEVLGPLLFEVARARDAQGLHAVMPEGVAVALALDQDHVAGLLRPLQAPEAVGKGPAA